MEYISLWTEHDRAAADFILIAFYYLLRIGEYTKKKQNETKQTVQFRFKDLTFFGKDANRTLRQLPRMASDSDIETAHSATLKLKNQKNGWKGVCIYHETNGDTDHCPVCALGCHYLHLQHHRATKKDSYLLTTMILANVVTSLMRTLWQYSNERQQSSIIP